MMRLLAFITLFFAYANIAFAQNLVPNPGFDEYSICPDNYSQIDRANACIPYRGSPDYFNGCDETQFVGTPLNLTHGYQVPISGDGYAGLIGVNYANLREVIGIELSVPLIIGEEYYIELYWSRATGGYFSSNCDCASSHLGALFTTQEYNSLSNPIPYDNFAHVYSSEVLIDTVGWNLISGWVIADSAYTHIAIGDFFELDVHEIDYLDTNPNEEVFKSYYYIENVCVGQSPEDCDSLLNARNIERQVNVDVFPNPASELVSIQAEGKNLISKVSLIDASGRLIESWNVPSLSQINIHVENYKRGFMY